MLDFANQELSGEGCGAEGREFSRLAQLTLPLFGIPHTMFVGLQSFFPVWRGEKQGFLSLATE